MIRFICICIECNSGLLTYDVNEKWCCDNDPSPSAIGWWGQWIIVATIQIRVVFLFGWCAMGHIRTHDKSLLFLFSSCPYLLADSIFLFSFFLNSKFSIDCVVLSSQKHFDCELDLFDCLTYNQSMLNQPHSHTLSHTRTRSLTVSQCEWHIFLFVVFFNFRFQYIYYYSLFGFTRFKQLHSSFLLVLVVSLVVWFHNRHDFYYESSWFYFLFRFDRQKPTPI